MAEQPPMYRQIAEDLRHKIESGQLGPGSQLPTELELREQYDASRNTVRDAVKWLITRRLVETRPGQGTFVVKIDPFVTTLADDVGFGGGEGAWYASEVTARQRRPTTTVPRVEIHQANRIMARDLSLEIGDTVVSRHQQRFIDDTLWSLQTTFYPYRFVEKGAIRLIQAENIDQGAVAYLAQTLEIEQVGYRDYIAVRAPDPSETTFFGLPSDGRVAVVEVRRTGFDKAGMPIRVTVSVFPADRNRFVVNNGDVPDMKAGRPSGHDAKKVTASDGSPPRGG
jgi:GntR family transcriptional regulator